MPLFDLSWNFDRFHAGDWLLRLLNPGLFPWIRAPLPCLLKLGLPFKAAGLLLAHQSTIKHVPHHEPPLCLRIPWVLGNQAVEVLIRKLGEGRLALAQSDPVGENIHESGSVLRVLPEMISIPLWDCRHSFLYASSKHPAPAGVLEEHTDSFPVLSREIVIDRIGISQDLN